MSTVVVQLVALGLELLTQDAEQLVDHRRRLGPGGVSQWDKRICGHAADDTCLDGFGHSRDCPTADR